MDTGKDMIRIGQKLGRRHRVLYIVDDICALDLCASYYERWVPCGYRIGYGYGQPTLLRGLKEEVWE